KVRCWRWPWAARESQRILVGMAGASLVAVRRKVAAVQTLLGQQADPFDARNGVAGGPAVENHSRYLLRAEIICALQRQPWADQADPIPEHLGVVRQLDTEQIAPERIRFESAGGRVAHVPSP